MNISNLRTIKSYVRREGRMTKGQAQALSSGWEQYGLEFEQKAWVAEQIFKQQAPWVVEIGFGNGQHLASMAITHPEKNYLGIEVYRPGVGSLLMTAQQHTLSNLKVCAHDAVAVMRDAIADQQLAEIYILCPDPWPKRRHHKRRLLQRSFVQRLYECLQPAGKLYIATDHEEYADYIQHVMAAFPSLTTQPCPIEISDRIATTKYAQRGDCLQHQLWIGGYQK